MKPVCIIQSPMACRAGYGDMARDIVRHIIEMEKYDVKLLSMPWGGCPMNALSESNPKDKSIINCIVQPPVQLQKQPELFIQISVPNEFQPIAKYNIGITAGIETTLCSAEWIEGMNRMDLILTISEHSKRVLQDTVFLKKDQNGNTLEEVKLKKPIEVLHNCVDTNIFKKIPIDEIPSTINDVLHTISEDFCFLFVGHWVKGNIGEDRKNVGMLIKIFGETFKTKKPKSRPALILKTSGAGFSVLDQEEILAKIKQIKESVGPDCPNIYLLHGELSEEEMNGLYNHPKIKTHVSFTKGEGFSRPLLEATQSKKPIIASGWSGHLDFLNTKDALLIGGELKQIEPGAVWEGVLVKESQWFNIDANQAANAMHYIHKNLGKYIDGAYRLAKINAENFGYSTIQKKTAELLDKYVPRFAMPVPLQLPKLRKIGDAT